MLLDEWYRGRVTYHLVGYLISDSESVIPQLISESESCETKSGFISVLKQRILRFALPGIAGTLSRGRAERSTQIDATLSALTYPERSLRALLLLFNIAILLANKKSSTRFPFRHYKLDAWDIEHITSVSSQMPENISGQKAWTEVMREHFRPFDVAEGGPDTARTAQHLLFDRAEALLQEEPFDSEKFEAYFSDVLNEYSQMPLHDRDDSIGNLTLLDQSTNRSYRNAIFPVKRNRIIEADKASTFVPPGTRNVFLKYYSSNVHEMTFWSSQVQDSYRRAITDALTVFFDGATYATR
ncbi:GmrSD restriction endonuclease domain-containing protein [Erwinia amylovora]|nr:DUF1524 domain-containing protein [Erwinia amylovora]